MTILGSTSPPRFPIGVSDYAELREGGYTYVDKTRWVAEVLDNSAVAVLVPRPRRFGKTLNMSSLRYFVERVSGDERESRRGLFEDTWIWDASGGRYRNHFCRYPVIYLSFKDVKEDDWGACSRKIVRLLSRCVRELEAADHIDRDKVDDAGRYDIVRSTAAPVDVFSDLLVDLSAWAYRATGERVVILIDEYDAPLHAAWQHGYLEPALSFFRAFLSGGYKDNRYLARGVLTGILRVAKEGVFSGLNNLEVASIISDRFVDSFGFNEAEVAALAKASGRSADMSAIRDWYNGYTFGELERRTLYNPWSVLKHLHGTSPMPRPHWKGTSDNALIRRLMRRHAATIGARVEDVLADQSVETRVDENVELQRLEHSATTVLDLLFFSGYLTAARMEATESGVVAALRIPNREVRTIFEDTFGDWLEEAAARTGSTTVSELTAAMLSGDRDVFERSLSDVLATVALYHDFAGRAVEAVYQALILGLLVHLDATHQVRSNRESGYGRADLLVIPRAGGPGAVMELKVVQPEFGDTVESALDAAALQIQERAYETEVLDAGAAQVHKYAVVFDGKRCWVRMVD